MRTFSAYLHLVKGGIFSGSFAEALQAHPNLIERSRYAKWLIHYLRWYSREQLHCLVFDELRQDPLKFARDLWRRLELPPAAEDVSLKRRVYLLVDRARSD